MTDSRNNIISKHIQIFTLRRPRGRKIVLFIRQEEASRLK